MSAGFVILREAASADETALRTLWCAAWEATYPAIDYQARWPNLWLKWHELKATIHVATRPHEIVGMMVLVPLGEEALLVEQIALTPAEQGSGTAHLLMEHAKKQTGAFLKLSVNAFNKRAIHFYEREGFRRTATGVNVASGLATYDYEWRR
jgi:putative acetyltransferase